MKEIDIPILNSHACGAWRGVTYTNSKEAIEHSYAIGFRNIEIDVSLTADGEFVVRHGTTSQEKYTKADFLSCGTYKTPLTMEDVMSFMRSHQDVHIMFDFHPGLFNRDCPDVMKRFAVALMESGGTDIYQRSLVEVYSEVNALALLDIAFDRVIFGWMDGRGGRIDFAAPPPPLDDFKTCMRFCSNRGIANVSIPASYLKSHPEELQYAKSLGLTVYSCGWQTFRDLRLAKQCGVDVATVDFIVPGGLLKNIIAQFVNLLWMNVRAVRAIFSVCR